MKTLICISLISFFLKNQLAWSQETKHMKFISGDSICDIDFSKVESMADLPYSTMNIGYDLRVLIEHTDKLIVQKTRFDVLKCNLLYIMIKISKDEDIIESIKMGLGDLNILTKFKKLHEKLKDTSDYSRSYATFISSNENQDMLKKIMEIRK